MIDDNFYWNSGMMGPLRKGKYLPRCTRPDRIVGTRTAREVLFLVNIFLQLSDACGVNVLYLTVNVSFNIQLTYKIFTDPDRDHIFVNHMQILSTRPRRGRIINIDFSEWTQYSNIDSGILPSSSSSPSFASQSHDPRFQYFILSSYWYNF